MFFLRNLCSIVVSVPLLPQIFLETSLLDPHPSRFKVVLQQSTEVSTSKLARIECRAQETAEAVQQLARPGRPQL